MKRFYLPLVALILLLLFTTCKDDDVGPDYPADGLVSYLALENNLNDAMGNLPPGVVNGGVTYVDGKIGKAIALNGIDQSVSFGRSSFHQDNSVSISVWFRTNEPDEGEAFIVCSNFRLSAGLTNMGVTMYMTPTDLGVGHPVTGDQWNHAVGTWDGSTVRLYVNGILEGTKGHPGMMSDDNDDLTIGFYNSNWWEGSVDEIHIYSRALGQAEITELYERGL